MNYKKQINGHLTLGYGSEYQLLRMLGWHRNEFNNAIATSTGVNSEINWFDFIFNGPEDKELLNFDFIKEQSKEWKNYWACGDYGINWDAVGLSKDKTYILLEAKANIDELKSPGPGGCEESVKRNNEVLNNIIKKYKINKTADDWNAINYQLANRIAALDFLLSKGIKAKLVYVLFTNGYEFNSTSNKSITKEKWKIIIEQELKKMGIEGTKLEKLINVCIFDCNRK